jgi:hypothetical protein
VCVNDAQGNYTALNLPIAGWTTSGLGSRHGAGGIRKYTKVQSLLVDEAGAEARAVHVPLQGVAHAAAPAHVQVPVRPREA